MVYLSNAFSLQMLTDHHNINLKINEVDDYPVMKDAYRRQIHYVIGHADTAEVISNLLKKSVSGWYGEADWRPDQVFNRESIHLKQGDYLYVFQLIGGRLPEGATKLPDGFDYKWLLVEICE